MQKRLSVSEIFGYSNDSLNLEGFQYPYLLNRIGSFLSREALLKKYQRDDNKRKLVLPSFNPQYIRDRQAFFSGLSYDSFSGSGFFDTAFPKQEGKSEKEFLYFCEDVYRTLKRAKSSLRQLGSLKEAKRLLKRFNLFESDLERTLEALDLVDSSTRFIIDTSSGLIVPTKTIPDYNWGSDYKPGYSIGQDTEIEGIINQVKLRMKKAVLGLAKKGKQDFRERIKRFVNQEFSYSESRDNLRSGFESLAMPIRLYKLYRELFDEFEEFVIENEQEGSQLVLPNKVYPIFKNNYDLRNLFPPSLIGNCWQGLDEAVPIDFRTRPNENKFLIAGLHSGGKSFFLENLVLLTILGQVPFQMFADSLVIPTYNRVTYYRGVSNHKNGEGKLFEEKKKIEEILSDAKKGDLLVFDEFLDSAATGVATWLVPHLLDKMKKTRATVFVSTHRGVNYNHQEKAGWVVLTPEYKIRKGKIILSHKLKRGRPNEKVNIRYVQQRCSEE